MYPRFVIFLLSALLWAATSLEASAAGRVALVIGNGNYEAANPLKNPTTDATAVSTALANAGFEVTYKENLNYSDMVRELGSFQRLAAKSDSAVIYFAGHGMEIDKQNFLIPVDAQLEFVSDADFQTVPLQLLQRAVSEADVLGLVIVDACRNNPFATRLSQVDDNRGVGFGLARVEPGGNTLVALAAREGTFAFDGKGENSPYAVALVKGLQTPGLEIGKLFRQLHDEVQAATNGAQQPVLFGSLSSQDYYFLPPLTQEPDPVEVVAEPAGVVTDSAVALQVELAFWQFAENSGQAEDFALYLESYPAGKFAPLARARLARMVPAAAPEPAADPVAAAPQPAPDLIAQPQPVVEPVQQAATDPPPAQAPSVDAEPLIIASAEPAATAPAAVTPAAEPAAVSRIEPAAMVPPDSDPPAIEAANPAPAEPQAVPVAVVSSEPAEPAGPPEQPVLPALAQQAALAPQPDPAVPDVVRSAFAAAPPELAAVASDAEALPEPELSGKALFTALQTALDAAGCSPGPIDGDWGAGSTRALAAFRAARPDLVTADAEPDATLLRIMALAPGPVCPTQCADGERLSGGACIKPVSCPAGQKLSTKGVCYEPAPVVRQKPAAKPRSSGCRIFNGRQIC